MPLAKCALFDQLQKSLTDEPDRPSQAETAREFGMTENAVKQACHRLRQRYRQLLREEIAHTVMVPGDIEDELRHLIAVFGRNQRQNFLQYLIGQGLMADPSNEDC